MKMKKMMKLLMALVLMPYVLCAAQWLDPNTGIFWQYTFTGIGDEAYLGNCNGDPTKWLYAAYPLPQGDIDIPTELEGFPVKGIGHYAFNNCSNLTSVTIPLGVVDIRDVVFYNCEKLERVTIPEGVTNIGERAFMYCTNLVSATIPSSVTRVRMETFYNCFGLRSANVSEGVTSIETRAFCACPSLAAVSIPSSVTNIGWMAFSGCDELMKVYVARGDTERIKGMLEHSDSGLDLDGMAFVEAVDDGGPYTEVVDGIKWAYTVSDGKAQVGDGLGAAISAETTGAVMVPSSLGGHPVTSIGAFAFYYCSGLMSVAVPSSVTSIGELAFCHCEALSSLAALSNVTHIGEASFSGCGSLTSVKIPAVRDIGDRAFAGCRGIRSVEIRTGVFDGVTSLSTAFPDAYESITDVVLSDGSEIVYRSEFDGCSALRSVSIPSGVQGIEVEAFAFCGNLMDVNLRPGASHLGYVADRAFQACMELQTMTLPSTVHTIGQNAFPSKSFTLYVGKGAVDRVQEMLWEASVDTSKIEFHELCSVYFYVTPKEVGKSAHEWREIRNGSCVGPLPMVSAEGFDGWWLFDTTHEAYVSEATAATIVNDDSVICGKWMTNVYQIDFKGLEGAANTNVTEFTTNDLPLVLGPVEREGWRFLGWTPNGGVIPMGTMTNVTFTANWEKLVDPPSPTDDLAVICEIRDEYKAGENVGEISVEVVNVDEPVKITVKGLPSGVKFKDGVITGAPKKSGVYAATVTVTPTTRGSAMAPVVQALTFVVRNPGEHVVAADYDAAQGSVKGMGVYAPGKKVTLKATAAKGWVCAGWFKGDVLVSRLASYVLTMPNDDVKVEARFVTATEDKKSIALEVDGSAFGSAAESGGSTVSRDVVVKQGMYLEWPVVASALSATTVKVSGLPSGLKFTAKDMKIAGTPKSASKVDKYGNVTPSKVKITVTTAGKQKQEYVINVTVRAIPAVGTFNGGGADGIVTLTVAKTGKLSGKWLAGGKTWKLSADGFHTWDDADRLTATLTAKCGKEEKTVELMYEDGRVSSLLFEAWRNEWKVEPWKSLAAQLKGWKVTVDPVELTVGANGTVKAKGMFDGLDGKPYSASCSTVLIPTETEGQYRVYLYFPPKSGKFGGFTGVVEIGADKGE